MRKLGVFNFATIDGYFEGPEKGQYAWHIYQQGNDENDPANNTQQLDSTLLFGRITYEHMLKFWRTEEAFKKFPEIADFMNKAEKIVFSNTLNKSDWHNTRIIGGNIAEEVKKLKKSSGKNMRILGSGSIVTQLAEAGLVDEFQLMFDPVAIGNGTSLFKGIKHPLNFKLISSKALKNGAIVITYVPA